MTDNQPAQPMTAAGRAHFETFVDNQHHDNVDAAYECSDDVDRCDACAQEADDITDIEAEAVADYLASDAFTGRLAVGLQGEGCLATYFGGNGCTCREHAAAIAAAMRGEQE